MTPSTLLLSTLTRSLKRISRRSEKVLFFDRDLNGREICCSENLPVKPEKSYQRTLSGCPGSIQCSRDADRVARNLLSKVCRRSRKGRQTKLVMRELDVLSRQRKVGIVPGIGRVDQPSFFRTFRDSNVINSRGPSVPRVGVRPPDEKGAHYVPKSSLRVLRAFVVRNPYYLTTKATKSASG